MRTNFSSSRLVRLLGDPSSAAVNTSRQDSVERLSLWVGVFDAVTLHARHQSLPTLAEETAPDAPSPRTLAVEEQFDQVRAVLVKAITAKEPPSTSGQRARIPVVQTAPPPEASADFAPYRKRYLDQQRNMELMISPLRAHVRQTLAAASPPLRQLAALDAAWEQMLVDREQKLLSTVPVLLKRRFEHLRTSHAHDDPALWLQPGGWLDVFGKELQEVLLAELDVRLQPVMGLMEAFSSEIKTCQ